MSHEPTPKKIILQNKLEEVSRAEKAVLQDAENHGYGGPDCFAVQLAMEEALANAIKHGNDNDPTKQVVVEYHVTDDYILISITDQGPGFSPQDVPDPTLDENLDKPFGRGVMLINTYMNEVAYSPTGNSVTMKKLRTPDPSP